MGREAGGGMSRATGTFEFTTEITEGTETFTVDLPDLRVLCDLRGENLLYNRFSIT